MEKTVMKFNERLKELRERRGLSQADFADKIGVSKSAISMYERGERTPDYDTLEAIADFFNVDIDYLLGREKGSTYYIDPEVAEIAQELFENEQKKILFDLSNKATKEDLAMTIEMLAHMVNKN